MENWPKCFAKSQYMQMIFKNLMLHCEKTFFVLQVAFHLKVPLLKGQ
jgi:hypothetical protein